MLHSSKWEACLIKPVELVKARLCAARQPFKILHEGFLTPELLLLKRPKCLPRANEMILLEIGNWNTDND